MKRAIFCALLLCAPIDVGARDVNGDGIVTYLIPVTAFEVAGAAGSIWSTEQWVHNGSSRSIIIDACGPPSPPCDPLLPGRSRRVWPIGSHLGSYFAIPADIADDVVVGSVRLFELSRLAQPVGVEIPVVREDEYFKGQRRFVGVPGNASSRVALRIWASRIGVQLIRIEVFRSFDGQLLADRTLPLIRETAPGMIFIGDLADAMPALRGVEHYDILLTPIEEEDEYWSIVSVTDNQTQQVFVISAR